MTDTTRLTDEQIDAIWAKCAREWRNSNPPLGSGDCSKEAIRIFVRAALASAAPQVAPEPVAWMMKSGHGTQVTAYLAPEFRTLMHGGRLMWTPLYASPAPAQSDPE